LPPGLYPHEIVPQVLELLLGTLRTGRTDGRHANYRGNADGDSDRRSLFMKIKKADRVCDDS
jgi:hypothetical protein